MKRNETKKEVVIKNIYRLNNNYILIIYQDGSQQKITNYKSDSAENMELLKEIQSSANGATDEAKSDALSICSQLEREAEKDKNDDDNIRQCEHIAQELDEIASGNVYKCPYCGEIHIMCEYEDSEHENDDGETCYTCPSCGEELKEEDLENFTLYDYFEDALDIEYLVNNRKEYTAVKICVAWGGPSIYIDTEKKAVCLYWWGDSAKYLMSDEAVEAVDAWAEEYFNI